MAEFRQAKINHRLKLRAIIIQAVRRFFIDNDFLEVETPLRIPAPAPEANIDAITSEEWFLQTSPELCMKRLLCAGYPRIFQICKSFRKKERGNRHLPELTLLEWYSANTSYLEMMGQCEELIRYIVQEIGCGESIDYQGNQIDLKNPWPRMSVKEAFNTYSSISLEKALSQNCFDETIAFEIEPHLGISKPLFLFDYPASQRAFSKLKSQDPSIAERFELYIQGVEICNAFSEITDPDEQKKQFEEELNQRKKSRKHVYPLPEKFLRALKDMPEASGNALGIDRLVMLFTDTSIIDDVVAFTPEEL
jgi:lysyl-tRNA synthetase class 2